MKGRELSTVLLKNRGICPLNFVIPQGAHIVSLCNAFRKIQNAAVTFTDAVVPAHGNITEHDDIGKVFMQHFLQKLIGTIRKRGGPTVIALCFTDLHTMLGGNFFDFFQTIVEFLLPDAAQEQGSLRFFRPNLWLLLTAGKKRCEGWCAQLHG